MRRVSWRVLPRSAWIVVALSAACLFAPEESLAQTASTNFNVSANVLSACTVEATDLDFGDYTASDVTPDNVTSTITVICTDGEDYAIALDAGEGDGATVAARSMTSGLNSLPYGLYTSNAYSTVWGDGTASTATVSDIGDGSEQEKTVYGRIPVGQYVPAGAYSDVILVTVTF